MECPSDAVVPRAAPGSKGVRLLVRLELRGQEVVGFGIRLPSLFSSTSSRIAKQTDD